MPRITTATKAAATRSTAAVKRVAAKKVVATKPVRKAPAKKTVHKMFVTHAAAKKVAATKRPAAKRVKAPIEVTPTKFTYSKATLMQELTDMSADSEVTLKQVKAVMASLETLILGAVHKRGVGEFAFPGLFKITTKKVAAKKGGLKKISPFTKEEVITKAKPATVRVRVRAGSKLKQVAVQ